MSPASCQDSGWLNSTRFGSRSSPQSGSPVLPADLNLNTGWDLMRMQAKSHPESLTPSRHSGAVDALESLVRC